MMNKRVILYSVLCPLYVLLLEFVRRQVVIDYILRSYS